jgi:HlyD family secretion protein
LTMGIPMMRRFFWFASITVLSVGLILPAAAQMGAPSAKTDSIPASDKHAETAKTLTAYKVAKAEFPHNIIITGELTPARSRDIKVPNTRSGFGNTVTFMVLEGTMVKQGERILEFDSSTLTSQQSEMERRVEEAKLQIAKTKVDQESNRLDSENALQQAKGDLQVAELYAKIPKDILPANTALKYKLDLERAQLALSKAQASYDNLVANIPVQIKLQEINLAQSELDLQRVENDVALLTIDAPQDGIVIYGDNWANARKIQVGDQLFPGLTVMTLPDLNSLQVIGNVYDTELRSLSVGMICDVGLDGVPGRTWRGRIASLTNVAARKGFASQHKVFKAVVNLEKIDLDVMRPGMTARLEIPVSLGAGLAIPREYIGMQTDGSYYVLKGADPKKVTRQNVQLGVYTERLAEILSGLSEGDSVLPLSAAAKGDQ